MPKTIPYVSNLDDNVREKAIEMLNSALSDSIDLCLAIKQAHWTMKGPSFIGLHELMDAVVDRMREHMDMIAERCIILGGHTHGTLEQVSANKEIDPYPADITWQGDHVDALTQRMIAFGGKLRQFINQSDEAGDVDTSDLFTEISRSVDKDAWFIGAHSVDRD